MTADLCTNITPLNLLSLPWCHHAINLLNLLNLLNIYTYIPHIHMCVCVYIFHIHTGIYTHAHMYIYICIYVNICIHTYIMYVYTHFKRTNLLSSPEVRRQVKVRSKSPWPRQSSWPRASSRLRQSSWDARTHALHKERQSRAGERVCCLLVLDSVTSTPQWIPKP